MSAQPSVNFRHLSIFCWAFCKLTSNFRASEGSSVNILRIHGTFCKLLSTFLESAGLSGHFRQISVVPWDLPSTFPASMGPSVSIPCLRRTFSRLPSTFVHPQDLPSTFRVFAGPFIRFPYDSGTFRQVPTDVHGTFCQLPSTSCASAVPSNNFRKHFVHPQNLPSTSVDFPCIVNLCQLFVRPGDLLSTFCLAGSPSINIPCIHRTCQLSSTSLYYTVVQAVQQSFLPQTHEIFSYDS